MSPCPRQPLHQAAKQELISGITQDSLLGTVMFAERRRQILKMEDVSHTKPSGPDPGVRAERCVR